MTVQQQPGSDGSGLLPAPEDVIAGRSGDVLIKHTVLKADHFPSCHNTKLTPILEGAPNFRKVEGLPVYGVAIPTVTGLRNVLHALNAQNGQRLVYWQNLREEPLIFINGQPFVVREADQPFSNLEYTGIDRTRVEDMEVRLKNDILAEAKKFGNQILVVHENADLSLYDHWEPVTGADVQTPQEVYAELMADGYEVDYLRIPVTDEKAPKDQDFEQLIQRLWNVPLDAALIFNCQMGRGRTTTGMIIAALLHLRKLDAFPIGKKPDTRESVPAWFRALSAKGASKHVDKETDKLKAGMYGVVRSLLRALEKGPEAKTVLDSVIDAASAMQNLRDGINSYRSRFLKESRERQRNTLLSVCLEYLERYYMLIAFTGYLQSPQFDPGASRHVSFPEWMESRIELRSILMRLLRRNSMAALELHVTQHPTSEGGAGEKDKEKDVVATRSGAVLGPFTILKEDNFPGMCSTRVEQLIEGAPNFRRMSFMPIFGVGMPTVEGIIGALKAVSGSTSPNASKRVHALWVNMREEPVVYINGKPFVLREEVRPLKNMMEYAGIDAARLEAMEERLKKDVLAEALKYGGRILVAQESFEPGHYGELFDTWEEIDHPDAVQTTAEVYYGLTKQGFAVQYARIPVTDGEVPSLADFDALIQNVMDFGLENPVIFNCQMGNCRTTMSMVVAAMLHIYSEGELERARDSSTRLDEFDNAADLGRYIVAGLSPRSDGDGERDGDDEYGGFNDGEEDEVVPKVWDLEPEELEEQRSLAAGGYVGVRRVVRLLEEGEGSKKVVDSIADACSELINLRVAIMKYRKPRSSYKYLRPELQQRTAAFKRGSAYLERYCMLIAFAFYLEHVGPETMAFSAWVESRPDLTAAIRAIQLNPAAALAPVPVAKVPALYQATEGAVDLNEQKRVLSKRRGRTLGQRTILKSYNVEALAPPAATTADGQAGAGAGAGEQLELSHMRKVENLPIYSVANVDVKTLQSLVRDLGAGPESEVPGAPSSSGRRTHILITDVREELVVYINGTPYIRRELEMPAAALHHAGVHAQQLEELEVLLKEDVQDEACKWTGRILLHKELPHAGMQTQGTAAGAPGGSGGSGFGSVAAEGATGKGTGAGTRAAGSPGENGMNGAEGTNPAIAGQKLDDVTALVDRNPGAAVAPFWEDLELGVPTSLRSPRETMEGMATPEGGGFSVSYMRLPLSRERTPEAQDVAQLHKVVMEAVQRREQGQQVVHLILSRTATGSSARFVAAALASYYMPKTPVAPASPSPASPAPGSPAPASPAVSKALNPENGEYRGIMALCRLLPGGFEAKMTVDSAVAACRQMGNLISDIRRCQVQTGKAGQPSGPSAIPVGPGEAELGGAKVSTSTSSTTPSTPGPAAAAAAPSTPTKPPGNPGAITPEAGAGAGAGAAGGSGDDGATAVGKGADTVQFAARQLGIHYLKRYFLLICYRTYLEKLGVHAQVTFDQWVQQQRELEHLLSHLTLDV